MRVMEVSGTDFDSLRLVERPVPEPKRGEVLVRITAATLNYRDLLMVQGGGTSIRSKTYVPLSCGRIMAHGEPAQVVRRADVQEAYLGKRHR